MVQFNLYWWNDCNRNFLYEYTRETDCFKVVSMAFSIWIGSYISIQKVQQKNTIKEVLKEWKEIFKVRSKKVPILAMLFMICIFVCIVVLNYFCQLRMIFDEMIVGFAIGGVLFWSGIAFKLKFKK